MNKLSSILKAQQEAEAKQKEAEEAAKKAAKAPVKTKMISWVEAAKLNVPEGYEKFTNEETQIMNDIIIKFNSFKKWASEQIEKL